MKKLILAAITLTSAASVFAQGTVIFNNRLAAPGGTTHVWWSPSGPQVQGNAAADNPAGGVVYPSGSTLIGTAGGLAASTTFAQILAANGASQPESSLLPSASPPTTFRTGGGAGNFAIQTATLAGVPLDAPVASLEIVAWDNSSGLYPTWAQASVAWAQGRIAAGRSAEFNVNAIGGTLNPAPTMDAQTSFNIFTVPEPTAAALAGLGAAAMLIFRRRK